MSGGSSTENESDELNESNKINKSRSDSKETEKQKESNATESRESSNATESREAQGETDAVEDEREMNEADLLENKTRESEDSAQASARSEFVSPDEIPSSSSSSSSPSPSSSSSSSSSSSFSSSEFQSSSSLSSPPSDGRVVREPTGDRPDLTELREELNEQFESIKIIEPGEYELNLMGLYDREEYIIALQENGRYVIQMPETWLGTDDE